MFAGEKTPAKAKNCTRDFILLMKKNHFIFLFLLLNYFQYNYCFSQNLVPNHSFEIVDTCFGLASGIYYGHVPPWDSPTGGSPDVYNSCSGTTGGSSTIPANVFGYQFPQTGNGYAGASFYNFINNREYIQVELDSTLIDHENYCVSFYVNHANRARFAVNNIGMYFSTTQTNIAGGSPLNFIPQINDTNIVSDDSVWTLIYGRFTSHGGERYIIIGNFYADSLTDTNHVHGIGSTIPEAYYYIDDVNVHCCTCDSVSNGVSEINKEEDIMVYPNPATTSLTVTLLKGEGVLTIYNIFGEKVFTTKIINTQTEIDVGNLPKGMYFVEVRTEKGVRRKKIVKE